MKHFKIISLLILVSFLWGCKEDAQEPGQAPEQEQERKIKVSVSYHPDGTEDYRIEYKYEGKTHFCYYYDEGIISSSAIYVYDEYEHMIQEENYDENGVRTSLLRRTWHSDGYIDSIYTNSKLYEIIHYTNIDTYNTREEYYYEREIGKKKKFKRTYVSDCTYLDAEHTQESISISKNLENESETKIVKTWENGHIYTLEYYFDGVLKFHYDYDYENENNYTVSTYSDGVLTAQYRYETIVESSKKQTTKCFKMENDEWVLVSYTCTEYY